jgi:hypothetical protein
MDFGVLGDLNWLAVAVAAIAYFAFGGLWFALPAIGKAWQRAMGWDPTAEDNPTAWLYIGPLITCIVATIAVAMLASAAGAETVGDGIVLGIVAGLGIAGSVLFVTGYFDPKKPNAMAWVALTGGYHLIGITIVAVVVSVWS